MNDHERKLIQFITDIKNVRILNIALLLTLLVLLSCHSIDTAYIRHYMWEYNRGYKFGHNNSSVIVFDKGGKCYISHDTIIAYDTPRAVIIKLDKQKDELYLKPIDKDSIGIYVNME